MPEGPVERIVVPVEGSTQELIAQEWAAEYAAALNCPLRAVHVATGAEDPPDDIFAYLRKVCGEKGVPFEHLVLHSTDVADELVEELAATDLAIIGTRLLGTEYRMGSLAEALVRRAPCPVQVIRLK